MQISNDLALKRTNYELNQELLHYFLKYLIDSTNRSEKTILNIKRDIEAFLLSLFENNDAMIQYKNIVKYLDYIEEKYKESSFISKASSLRQFINWLNLEENPFWKIKIAVSYDDFKFYSIEDIFTKSEEQFDYPNLIIRTLYELYLSIDELSSLRIADYNLASKQINVRSKQIIVSEALSDALRFYLKNHRPSLCANDVVSLSDSLFVTKTGEELKTLDIISILKERDLKNIYLKRSRIIHLMDESKSQSEIEEQLGIKLSSFYAPFIKEKDYRLLSAYNEFHPRGRMSS